MLRLPTGLWKNLIFHQQHYSSILQTSRLCTSSQSSLLPFCLCSNWRKINKIVMSIWPYLPLSKSWSHICNEIWIFWPFSKAAKKTGSCFPLDTEHQYWTVTVQSLCRLKKISITRNDFPLHSAPSQASYAKIEMLTTSSRIIKILLQSFSKYLGL